MTPAGARWASRPRTAEPELVQPIEHLSDERAASESFETDEAADRVDHDIVQERTAAPIVCSLPDEERSDASDLA